MTLECPNCEAVFGIIEIQDEYCAACGWPHGSQDDDPEDSDDSDGDYSTVWAMDAEPNFASSAEGTGKSLIEKALHELRVKTN